MRDIRNDLEERASIIQEPRFFTFEQNIDRPGHDYKDTPTRGASGLSAAKQKPDVAPAPTLGPVYKVLQAAVG